MIGRRSAIVIDLDETRLAAIECAVGASVSIRRSVEARLPDGIALDDASAVGRWLAETLDAAKFGRGDVLMSLPRREAVLKGLHFPDTADARDELVEMVGLQMDRHVSTAVESSTTIDFGEERVRDGKLHVLAAAVPTQRLEYLRQVLRTAKRGLAGVTLRSLGAARLASEAGSELIVTIGARSAEFAHVSQGRLLFSRAIEIERPAEPGRAIEHYAEKLSVEAKRTWMGLRVSVDGPAVDRVVVLGAGDVADEVAVRCGHATQLEAETRFVAPWLAVQREAAGDALAGVLPLAGLLCPTAGRLIDFEHPSAPPDRTARTRQVALGSVLALIVLGGGGWVLAQGAIGRLESQVRLARETNGEVRSAYEAQLVSRARLAHFRAVREPDVSWLAHLDSVARAVAGEPRAILDNFTGTAETEVRFNPEGSGLLGGAWTLGRSVAIGIAGRGIDEPATARVREALLEGGIYRVQTQGPDGNAGFKLRLGSGIAEPASGDAAESGGAP